MVQIITKKVEFELAKLDINKGEMLDNEGKPLMEKHHAILKRLSFGEKNGLEEECTEIRMNGNVPSAKMNTARYATMAILRSTVTSTTPLTTPKQVDDLPQEVGILLFNSFVELNTIHPK